MSQEELTRVFRAVSQKRRHGILHVGDGAEALRISFHNGKIVEVLQLNYPTARAICDRLIGCGFVKTEQVAPALDSELSASALYEAIVVRNHLVKHADFMRAKTAYEMNLLYDLRKQSSGRFEFVSKVVQPDPKLALSVAPGQFLLDMVELETQDKKLSQLLRGASFTDVFLSRKKPDKSGLTENEQALYELSDGRRSLAEICRLTLLTEYQLREALVTLCDRQVVDIGRERGMTTPAIESPNPVAATREIIGQAMNLLQEMSESDVIASGESEELEMAAPDPIDDTQNEVAAVATKNGHSQPSESRTSERNHSRSRTHEQAHNYGREAKSVTKPRVTIQLRQRLLQLNMRTLTPDVFSKISLLTIVSFLLAVCLVAPTLFTNWFEIVSHFLGSH